MIPVAESAVKRGWSDRRNLFLSSTFLVPSSLKSLHRHRQLGMATFSRVFPLMEFSRQANTACDFIKVNRTVRLGCRHLTPSHGETNVKKKKPSTTKPGTVEKIIKSPFPQEPEKAEISVEGADHLYREIRIENTLTDEKGNKVKLVKGAQVDITVEADPNDTVPKNTR